LKALTWLTWKVEGPHEKIRVCGSLRALR